MASEARCAIRAFDSEATRLLMPINHAEDEHPVSMHHHSTQGQLGNLRVEQLEDESNMSVCQPERETEREQELKAAWRLTSRLLLWLMDSHRLIRGSRKGPMIEVGNSGSETKNPDQDFVATNQLSIL